MGSDASGFHAAVNRWLAPELGDLGFTRTRASRESVQFESSGVRLTIYHERGLELDVAIQRKGDKNGPYFLSELWQFAGRPPELAAAQSSDAAIVERGVRSITDFLVTHGRPFLAENEEFFEALESSCRFDAARAARSASLMDALKTAREAFQRGDYDSVIRLLGPFKKRLGPSDAKRLEIASRRSSRH